MPRLNEILRELHEEKARLDAAIQALESIGNNTTTATRYTGRRSAARAGRRTMSLAARRRVAAAQRERWQKFRRKTGGQAVRTSRGRQGGFSPEHLARLRAAAKKRWAKVRAGKKKK